MKKKIKPEILVQDGYEWLKDLKVRSRMRLLDYANKIAAIQLDRKDNE